MMKQFAKHTLLKPVVALSMLLAPVAVTSALAQDYQHPRDMQMPDNHFQMPNPAHFQQTLNNGLVAYVVPDNRVPMVTISAFVRAGKISDDKEGAIEALISAMRHEGSSEYSAADFHTALKHMVADYQVVLHDEWTDISINVPKDDYRAALPLIAEIITNPAISKAAINRASKGGAVDAPAGGIYDGSMGVAVDKFHDILYRGHAYGYKPTAADYKRLKTRDLEALHKKMFVAKNMTLAVSGDIDPVKVSADIQKWFGPLSDAAAPQIKSVAALTDKPAAQYHYAADKLLTWVVAGHSLPQISGDERPALELMNYILGGGHFWTRMFIVTRDKYGLSNDASGYIVEHWNGSGSYSFHTSSRHDVLKTNVHNMMAEAKRIREGLVTDEELMIAKNALADGVYEDLFNGGTATARTFALSQLRYGQHDLLKSYEQRVRAVSRDQVLAAAKKYIRLDQMQTVLVGQNIQLND